MGKKITYLVVLLAAVLLALPSQAQVKKQKAAPSDVKEMRMLQKDLKVRAAEMTKQKEILLVKAIKENDPALNELISKWDWAAHAAEPFVQANGKSNKTAKNSRGTLKSNRTVNMLRESAFGGKANTTRYAASTNQYGIITSPEEGEHKFYTREGMAYYANGGSIYYAAQSGHVEIVELEDGTVYIKDIISRYTQGSWVKGTKQGNTITVPAGQPLAFNTAYAATLSVFKGEYDSALQDDVKVAGDITFTINGNAISLDDSDEDHYIGIFWDDDDTWSGYADYETVWTLDESYTPPSTELIELPEGATVENWYADGTNYANSAVGFVPTNVKVAFTDNEVYLSGIFSQFPNSWIKGTIEGTKVSFPTLQYIGTYSASMTYDMWIYTADFYADGTYEPSDAVTFTYDAEARTMTMDEGQLLAANAASDRLYYVVYIDALTISAEGPDPIKVPYTADFTQFATMRNFTIIDANNDGSTWGWSESNYAHYTYSMANKGDDYLILPVELEANKNYNVVVEAASYSESWPEKFEVKVGKEGTPEGLTTTAISETTVASGAFLDIEGSFTTEEAGIYYVAIHATSDPDQYYLKVRSLTIEAGAEATAPAAVADFTAVAGAEGALEVNISFTAPAIAVNGSALTGTENVMIYRDNELVKTFEGVAAGSAQTWQDTDVKDATLYTYYVQAANASGNGVKSDKISVWVGQDLPADVDNVNITGCTATSFNITWDPVKGANGGYVDAANVEYSIVTLEVIEFWGFTFLLEDETLDIVVGETTATIDYPVDEGDQGYKYIGVKATIKDSESDPTAYGAFDYLQVGAPYDLPIHETFTGQALHYVWYTNANAALGVSADGSDDQIALALQGYDPGLVTFEIGKLNLKAAANPTLLFDAKKGDSAVDEITIYGVTPDGVEEDIETVKLGNEYQTHKVVMPTDLKNERWAKVGFKAEFEAAEKYVLIDNIKILDLYEYDLSIALAAPKTVLAGETATITATVKNEGENEAKGYNVVIKAGNNELLNTTVNEALSMFATAEFTAELTTTIFDDAADVNITAVVTYANDLNPNNDETEAIVSIKEPSVPSVTNVTAEEASAGVVVVNWVAPDIDAIQAEEVTEDFEEGTGGWTFIDADGDGFNWEHHINTHETGTDITTHSGDGSVYSESFNNDLGSALFPDNWLVSPDAVLDGTFKFWAIGQDASWCDEHFQVFVSTTSPTDISTFEPVGEEFVATGEYKEYSVDLSSYGGVAGWIAIRHFNVTDMFLLVVDDITYLAGAGVSEIERFNIYVDGELATTAAADQATATVEGLVTGTHTVAVSVVYTNGKESKPVTASVTTALDKITVITQPVDVYSLDGKLVRKQTTALDGLKGAYIVDGKKVILK